MNNSALSNMSSVSMPPSASPDEVPDLPQWRTRTAVLQRSHATPAQRAARAERRARNERLHTLSARGDRLHRSSMMSTAAFLGSNASYLSASTTGRDASQPGSASRTLLSLQTAFGDAASSQTVEEARARSDATSTALATLQLSAMVCDEDEGNAAYDEAMNQLSEAGFAWARSDGVGPEAAAELAGASLDDLLGSLKTEPSNDEDCAARFTLYERHAETVASVRNSLLKFWEDAEVEMTEAAPRAAIDEQIRQIDSHRNLELFELSRCWFVYSMAVAVSQNEKKIQEVLRAIRSKITLLAEDGQNCSICLEPMLGSSQGAAANSVVALGCAHKLHADCWRHWSAHCVTSRKVPFCPTCRNNDFLDEIL